MAKVPKNAGDASGDVRLVKLLVELMRANDLSELRLETAEAKVLLRRGERVRPPPPHAPGPPHAPAPHPHTPPAMAAAVAPAADASTVFIKSPTVGTYYLAPTPGAPPFVSVGSAVKPDTVVGLVLAMKVQSDVHAEVVGTIVEVLVKNEAFVEVGTPLYRAKHI